MSCSENIVITGIAGSFPKSSNVKELFENLLGKKDLLSDVDPYWKAFLPDIPSRIGKLAVENKFDPGFFGIHYHQAEAMDVNTRRILEVAIEAILDSGTNPKALFGSRTGVFIGEYALESDKEWFWSESKLPNFGITGRLKSMRAQQISYRLGLEGPSVSVDSACCTSFYALEQAVTCIKSGRCDAAIVGAVHVNENPYVHHNVSSSGVLDLKGLSKIFDDDENGYVRSEAIVAIYIQNLKEATRMYSEVLTVKTNSDGFKKKGIMFPSKKGISSVFREAYNEIGIDPATIAFSECHATGTKPSSTVELSALERVFLPNREKPLIVGSVKSYIGHTEGSSGLCSLIKVLMGLENGCILPNIGCNNLRKDIEVLHNGKVVVPTECVPLSMDEDLIVGINNYGIGGTNSHVVLKHHKQPRSTSAPRQTTRLVCASARTLTSLHEILDRCDSNDNYLDLLQNIFKQGVPGSIYRGFALVGKSGEILMKSVNRCEEKLPLFLTFTDCSESWFDEICEVPVIYEHLAELHKILLPQMNLMSIVNKRQPVLTAGVALQVVITALLKDLVQQKIKSNGVSSGIISSSYCNGTLTAEEAILTAHRLTTDSSKTNHDVPNAVVLSIGSEVSNTTLNLSPNSLLPTLGRLYQHGFDLDLEKLYPRETLPITLPLISPLIAWHHEQDWYVRKYKPKSPYKNVRSISLGNNEWSFLSGHVIDGLNFFPGSAYLYLLWMFYLESTHATEDVTIVLEDVKFVRPCIISKQPFNLTIEIARVTRRFEITDGDNCVATGRINTLTGRCNDLLELLVLPTIPQDDTMDTKDIYKKLTLQGYNYANAFCGLKELNLECTMGTVNCDNWITIMDQMEQLCIVRMETNDLYLPTYIGRLTIDLPQHRDFLKSNVTIPVHISKFASLAATPGVQMKGIKFAPIKRRPQKRPTLEVYKFVPFEGTLSVEDSVVVHTQLILENIPNKLKVVEIVDEYIDEGADIFVLMMMEELKRQMFVESDFVIYSSNKLYYKNVPIENKGIDGISQGTTLVVLSQATVRPNVLEQIFKKLPDAFVLSRECAKTSIFNRTDIVSIHHTDRETFILFRKATDVASTVIEVANENFDWLPKLQRSLLEKDQITLLSQEPNSGILGLVTCLNNEGNNVSSIFLMDSAHTPTQSDLYKRKLSINVWKNGEWGSYRHLPLKERKLTNCNHMVACVTKGDISSVRWIHGPLTPTEDDLFHVVYAGFNFRDTVIASGSLHLSNSEDLFDAHLGCEFAGKNLKGERFMGITSSAISNLVSVKTSGLCSIPEGWTMEDAATVPIVYSTVLYALLEVANLKQGQSILIHSGAGGVGQAAINVASYFHCNIFTTVGSEMKKIYLKDHYPFLKLSQIGNSRNSSFEEMILKCTGGKGVDLVINSLADEKLQASLRCLGPKGKFLEIGKYDLIHDNTISLHALARGRSFSGVHLDSAIYEDNVLKQKLQALLMKGMKMKCVKPLPRVIYEMDDVRNAIEFMSRGAHIGKILIRIDASKLAAEPRFYCHTKMVYVVVGGLGGFGLELVEWLIERGAKNLVIASRRGPVSGYQRFKLQRWCKRQVKVVIAKDDLSRREECRKMLLGANTSGIVDAIFNLAAELNDAHIENQTKEMFAKTMLSKITITENLDFVSRQVCPQLRKFVVFSSVASGRGNAGQTNYGMANSATERICERRRFDGYPAVAIQWGPIDNVGLTVETKTTFRGLHKQEIGSCLNVMDGLMMQDEAIVVSHVLIEVETKSEKPNDFLSTVSDALGMTNMKHASVHITLASLGIDSASLVQLRQLLKTEYNIFITTRELRTMTLSMLQEKWDKSKTS